MPNGPTPDLDRKTVAWAGVNTDGTPCSGRIILTYQGPVMLDDDPEMPISVYPTKIELPLTTRTLILQQGDNFTTTQVVGYVEAQIPASNDPDLTGFGGTYLVVEDLDSGNGVTREVVIDLAASGVIWLNRLTSVPTKPGEAPPYVSLDTIQQLRTEANKINAEVALIGYRIDNLNSVQYVTPADLASSGFVTSAQLADGINQVEDELDDWPDLALIVQAALI